MKSLKRTVACFLLIALIVVFVGEISEASGVNYIEKTVYKYYSDRVSYENLPRKYIKVKLGDQEFTQDTYIKLVGSG